MRTLFSDETGCVFYEKNLMLSACGPLSVSPGKRGRYSGGICGPHL